MSIIIYFSYYLSDNNEYIKHIKICGHSNKSRCSIISLLTSYTIEIIKSLNLEKNVIVVKNSSNKDNFISITCTYKNEFLNNILITFLSALKKIEKTYEIKFVDKIVDN